MGEVHHPSTLENAAYKEPEEDAEHLNYTDDWFQCGLCGMKLSDIESYVNHMVLKEQCVLHLCPSVSVRDLLLPRFSRKKLRAETEEVDIKHLQQLVPVVEKEGLQERKNDDVEVIVQATEIETGGKKRWKCHICGLTFSRQAAITNHHKLQHRGPVREKQGAEIAEDEYGEMYVKKESAPDSKIPVKHIVAVQSEVQVKHLADELTYRDKEWTRPTCELCGQTFKTGKILRTHNAIVHSHGRPFQCDFDGCSQSFKTKGSLTRHLRRHTGERPFSCQDCGRCFRESGSLARHQQSRVSCVDKKDSQLPLYGRTKPIDSSHLERKPAVQQMKLNSILKEENFGGSSDGEDEDINKISEESKLSLRAGVMASKSSGAPMIKQEETSLNHLRQNNSLDVGRPLVSCKIEHNTLPSLMEEEELDNDLVMEHADAMDTKPSDIKPPQLSLDIMRKSFTCPVCCRNYSRKSTLMFHMKNHLDQLGEQCNQCGKTFANQQSLSRHLVSHSSVRQYVCQLCSKAFKLLSHAKGHLHSHTTSKSVPCRYCNSFFKTVSARNTHERTHSNAKTFVCLECQKSFVTKASLIRHLRIHTGEAPFQCQYCGRCFKEHGTLSRHLKHKMPCAQQSRLENESGDLGIRLFPGNAPRNFEVEINRENNEDQKSEVAPNESLEDTVSLRSSVFEDEDEEANTHFLLLKNNYVASSRRGSLEEADLEPLSADILQSPAVVDSHVPGVVVEEVRGEETSYIIISGENSPLMTLAVDSADSFE